MVKINNFYILANSERVFCFVCELELESSKILTARIISMHYSPFRCLTHLLTQLAITTCFRSWPQLNYDATHPQLLKLGTYFRYPALIQPQSPGRPNANQAVLFCDFHHLVFEWIGAIHTKNMILQSKTLYFNTLHYVDVIVYIVQLLILSYAPFSSIAIGS